jgi:diguanylate cyclase (GGDEF)-like protein/PAS domain S-box-containing protein
MVGAERSARLETRITALEAELETLRGTLAALSEALIVTDAFGRIDYVNPAGLEMLGLDLDEVAGRPLREVLVLVDGDDDMAPEAALDLTPCLVEGLRIYFDDLSLRQPGGRRLAIEGSAAAIRGSEKASLARHGEPIVGAALLLSDARERQNKAQRWQRAAIYDALTGLLNREAFTEHVARAREAERRGISRGHVLLHLDLDQFQVITDACGFAAGNQLIQWVASLIRERLRDDDVLARLGGDEFGLLVPRSTVDGALQLAGDIHGALSFFRFVWQDRSFSVDLSIGLVPFEPDLGSAEELLAAAEKACSLAKAQGRGRSQVFRHDADELRERQGLAQWAMRVRQALEENHFALHWQRIRPLQAGGRGRPLFFEILLRLRDPGGKLRLPGEFLPAAERFGLAGAIDRWVVKASCEMLARQPAEFLASLENVSINLSGVSVGDRGMLEFILQQLERTGCPADRLCFEITETAAVSNLHRAVQMIEALRDRGCRWALDDFGSGMASYRYLSELPVDYIKIDGKIVAEMLSSPLSWTMVQSIHQLAHVMGARTIAERIENAEVLAELERLGLDYGQGYFLDMPRAIAPAEDAAALLAAELPVSVAPAHPALVRNERGQVG